MGFKHAVTAKKKALKSKGGIQTLGLLLWQRFCNMNNFHNLIFNKFSLKMNGEIGIRKYFISRFPKKYSSSNLDFHNFLKFNSALFNTTE